MLDKFGIACLQALKTLWFVCCYICNKKRKKLSGEIEENEEKVQITKNEEAAGEDQLPSQVTSWFFITAKRAAMPPPPPPAAPPRSLAALVLAAISLAVCFCVFPLRPIDVKFCFTDEKQIGVRLTMFRFGGQNAT